MKKLILMGRSESGKSTLISALRKESLSYHKTQYVDYGSDIIDTPGEYAEHASLGGALALYSCEADVVGFVISATEPYSLFPPNIAPMATRPVIGIVAKADDINANVAMAVEWLKISGCEKIFITSSFNDVGVEEILDYLSFST